FLSTRARASRAFGLVRGGHAMAIGDALRSLGRLVAEVQDGARDVRAREPAEVRLSRVHQALRERRRAARRSAVLAPAVAAAALVLVVGAWRLARHPTLEFVIGAAREQGALGAWITAPSQGSETIAFSDGSRVVLAEGAQARVVDASEHGARVVIERGTVR